jgi:hypothetical protein
MPASTPYLPTKLLTNQQRDTNINTRCAVRGDPFFLDFWKRRAGWLAGLGWRWVGYLPCYLATYPVILSSSHPPILPFSHLPIPPSSNSPSPHSFILSLLVNYLLITHSLTQPPTHPPTRWSNSCTHAPKHDRKLSECGERASILSIYLCLHT